MIRQDKTASSMVLSNIFEGNKNSTFRELILKKSTIRHKRIRRYLRARANKAWYDNYKEHTINELRLPETTEDAIIEEFIAMANNLGVQHLRCNKGVQEYKIKMDLFENFKNLLNASRRKAFSTDIPFYCFFKKQNYPINKDGSITLKKAHNYFNIIKRNGKTICYPSNLKSDQLTFDNIKNCFFDFLRTCFFDII